jgi:hypothetical protein
MSLMKMIAMYDAEREEYIIDLEKQLREEKERSSQLLNLALEGARDREKITFELIMNGSLRRPE